MSCTCTEEFEQIGNVRIGRNKVECAECISKRLTYEPRELILKEIQEKKSLLNNSDYKIIRQLENNKLNSVEWEELKNSRNQLRNTINQLESKL